jgi:hypothetical protein
MDKYPRILLGVAFRQISFSLFEIKGEQGLNVANKNTSSSQLVVSFHQPGRTVFSTELHSSLSLLIFQFSSRMPSMASSVR